MKVQNTKNATPDKKSVSPVELVAVAGMILFLVGLIWSFVGFSQRKTLYRQSVASQRMVMNGSVDSEQVAQLQSVESRLNQHVENSEQEEQDNATSVDDLSGIELSAAIQTFIHEYRSLIEKNGIELLDRDLGFADYTREVAIVANERELKSLTLQLEFVKQTLDLFIQSNALGLVSISKSSETEEIPGEEGVNPETGVWEQLESSFKYNHKVVIKFEGYTNSVRDFLNLYAESSETMRLTALRVEKSSKSEEDRTSQLIALQEQSIVKPETVRDDRSPFASYIQDQPAEDETMAKETRPLIGEMISEIEITLEKGVIL